MLRVLRASAGLPARAAARQLAIPATVKVASDTSGMNFPAPSHVSLQGEAANIARQVGEFYSSPDSVVKFGEEARAAMLDEIMKVAQAIPGGTLTEEEIKSRAKIPAEIRLGDNPIFGVYKSDPAAKS